MSFSPGDPVQKLRELALLRPPVEERSSLALGVTGLDRALGGGLAFGALHECAPAHPAHLGAMAGFALALAAQAARKKQSFFIQTDFARHEAGALYAPGLDLFGHASDRITIVRVPRPTDVLYACEEALKCRALGCVLAELTAEGAAADLTATRRLSLAAREGRTLGLLLHHRLSSAPSAAMTRWTIAARPGGRDGLGGLSAPAFLLSLTKNRRGPCGDWTLQWSPHASRFIDPAHSLDLATAAFDRPDRTAHRRTG